jgi:hypothetical protein
MKRLAALAAIAGAVALTIAGGASSKKDPGFKTAKPAYLVPMVPGASVDPILSAGDTIGGYQMSGIPDGLGAYKDGHHSVQLLMNHELGRSFPAVPPGVDARISKLTIDRKTHGARPSTSSRARSSTSAFARQRSRRSRERRTT